MIPEQTSNGDAEIFVNAFTDWPSNGGTPLTKEFSIIENIKNSSAPTNDSQYLETKHIIIMKSDKTSYQNGDEVFIYGEIKNYDPQSITEDTVSLVVESPDNNLVTISQVIPNSDGSFDFSFIAGGNLWKTNGDYIVKAKYGAGTSSLTLDYVGGEMIISQNDGDVIPEPEYSDIDFTMKTSKEYYNEGDALIISGNVWPIVDDRLVTLQVFHGDNLVEIAQIQVNQNGNYSHTIIAEGPLWRNSGEYVARALYGEGNLVETTFSLLESKGISQVRNIWEVDAGSQGTFDIPYGIINGSIQNIKIDKDSISLIIEINSNDQGTVRFDIPRTSFGSETSNGQDGKFFVLINGVETSFTESVDSEYRSITINFVGMSEIEIIGTYLQ